MEKGLRLSLDFNTSDSDFKTRKVRRLKSGRNLESQAEDGTLHRSDHRSRMSNGPEGEALCFHSNTTILSPVVTTGWIWQMI
ncbi:hypothetical protein AOLI_G00189910 [Acnodon oligacanthus]